MLLKRSFWSELIADYSEENGMEVDRIKAYSAYVRVALNNLRSVCMRGDLYGSTGDTFVDRELGLAMRSLREIEAHFHRLARESERAGGNLEAKIHAE